MTTDCFYSRLAQDGLRGQFPSDEVCRRILGSPEVEILSLLNAAFAVRQAFRGRSVTIHILNNAQNGSCQEDCHYCAQAKTSDSPITEYPIKPDEEILAEARKAYERGAHRYCMVFAGRGPSVGRVQHLAGLIRRIKERYPIEVCVSAGILSEDKARILKEAGLDRLNHNLNTSRQHYPKICTTHTYDERLGTLHAARQAGIELCSGLIVGMGETHEDILEVAKTLRDLRAESIPINFFIPIDGHQIPNPQGLTPEFCLRVLCLFRFMNPRAEIRIAAGREIHLRSLEVMALYAADSLFMDGYLNAKGEDRSRTLQMIKDAGFVISSEHPLDELIAKEKALPGTLECQAPDRNQLKAFQDLRPEYRSVEK